MARSSDKYANIASASTVIDNATYTFTELLTGISLGQGMGIVIDQIDYTRTITALADLDNDSDYVQYGWTTSNTLTSLAVTTRGVIHSEMLARIDAGTAGDSHILQEPHVAQFFPPLIVAAPRLFLATYGGGTVSEGNIQSRIYFRYISLTSQEYLELAETFVLVG